MKAEQEEIEALRKANAKLSRLLAISEFQKEKVKKERDELREKLGEVLANFKN